MSEKKAAAVDHIAVWIEAYREASSNAKKWADTADRAKEHIQAALEESGAEIGTVRGKPAVRWTVVESSRLDTKKLCAEHPELVGQFTVPATSRRFAIVEVKET